MNKDRNDLAVVLYNDLKPQANSIAQNLIDFTDFKLHGQYNLNIFHTQQITQTIKALAQQGFEWAVVVSAGNFLQDQALLFQTVDHAKQEGSPLACHILDRGGYFHFHPQWFAIDLVAYTKIGSPDFEEFTGSVELTTVTTQRCADNVHDDYTPWWVAPSDNQPKNYVSDYGYFGLKVIAEFVRHGHRITNIPTQVRHRKNYCYPDFNVEGIEKLIHDPSYEPDDPKGPLWWFKHALGQLTGNLKVGYYVLNTEHLHGDGRILQTPMDCFVGVCGGLKPACIAGRANFADDSDIYLFDISAAALAWQQHLVESWSGEFADFDAVFKNFRDQHPDYVPIYFSNNTLEENFDWFLSNANITRQQFAEWWKRYRQMNHHYVELNLLDDNAHEQVLSLVANSQLGAYVWTSNAFKMDYLMFYKTNAWCNQHSENFVKQLTRNSPVPMFIENCGRLDFAQPM